MTSDSLVSIYDKNGHVHVYNVNLYRMLYSVVKQLNENCNSVRIY